MLLRTVIAGLLFLFCETLPAAEPVLIAEGAPPLAPQQPQLQLDSAGNVHLAYAQGNDVYYTRSVEGGTAFQKPLKLPNGGDISLGMRRGPRIAVGEGFLCITVIGGRQGKGRDGDLLAFRSRDDGKTWDGGVKVNDVADAAREGLHATATSLDGNLCCAWLDLRSRRAEVMAAVSKDGGASWGKNVRVYRSPDGSVCECCHPSVAFDKQGRIYVLWRNSLAGARDMYLSESNDGSSFGKARKLGYGTWPLNACPMDGGAVAATADGQIASIWRRDKSVILNFASTKQEILLGAGEQPWIAANNNGPVMVWLTKRGGPLLCRSGDKETAIELATAAGDPVVAARTDSARTAIAWESLDGSKRMIYCRVMDD